MTRFLKCDCAHCGGHIEFPAELFGTEADCPHCHAQTLLAGSEEAPAEDPAEELPPSEPSSPKANGLTAPARSRARRRRFLPRWWLAAAVILLAGSSFGVWQWTGSPRYSAGRIISAVERHDLSAFHRFADVESLASRAVDDLLAFQLEQTTAKTPAERFGTALGAGFLELAKPRLIEQMKETVSRLVETGPSTDERQVNGQAVPLRQMLARMEKAKFIVPRRTKIDGNIAVTPVGVHTLPDNAEFTLELKFRRTGHYWQLCELSNLKEVIAASVELAQKRIDALNAPIRKEMTNTLRYLRGRKGSTSDRWDIVKKVELSLSVQNLSSQRVTGFSALVKLRKEPGGELLYQLRIKSSDAIEPGGTDEGTWTVDVSDFDPPTVQLYDTSAKDLKVVFEPQTIDFEGGKQLRLLESPF